MLGSSIVLAGGVLVLLLLGKLHVMSSAALLKYGIILINLAFTTFIMCAAARLALWFAKK